MKDSNLQTHEDIALSSDNYGSGQKQYLKDYDTESKIYWTLGPVFSGERDMTPAGIAYLRQYGHENIARIIIASGGYGTGSTTIEEITEWLRDLRALEA